MYLWFLVSASIKVNVVCCSSPRLFLPLFHFAVVPQKAESCGLPAIALLASIFMSVSHTVSPTHSCTHMHTPNFLTICFCTTLQISPLCMNMCMSLYAQNMCIYLNKYMLHRMSIHILMNMSPALHAVREHVCEHGCVGSASEDKW